MPGTEAFDIETAAVLARLVYDDYEAKRNHVASFSWRGMEAAIYEVALPKFSRPRPVCVLRGSDDANDWRRNLRAFPWPYDGQLWHFGFLTEAERVLSWLYRSGFPEYLTGHSRGAAVVQILACWTAIPTVGFAAPRPAWLSVPPAPHVELYCGIGDPVCYAGRILGYRHVGRVKWLNMVGHTMRRYLYAVNSALFEEKENARLASG